MISLPQKMNGKKPTCRSAYFMSLSAWLYSAVFASLPIFGVRKKVPSSNHDGRPMFARVNNIDDPELTVDEQYAAKTFLHRHGGFEGV